MCWIIFCLKSFKYCSFHPEIQKGADQICWSISGQGLVMLCPNQSGFDQICRILLVLSWAVVQNVRQLFGFPLCSIDVVLEPCNSTPARDCLDLFIWSCLDWFVWVHYTLLAVAHIHAIIITRQNLQILCSRLPQLTATASSFNSGRVWIPVQLPEAPNERYMC